MLKKLKLRISNYLLLIEKAKAELVEPRDGEEYVSPLPAEVKKYTARIY